MIVQCVPCKQAEAWWVLDKYLIDNRPKGDLAKIPKGKAFEWGL